MKSDSDLQSDIRLALLRQFSTDAQTVDIQVLDGVVTLTGHVGSERDKWRLNDLIHAMADVKVLIDDTLVVHDAQGALPAADAARPWFPAR